MNYSIIRFNYNRHRHLHIFNKFYIFYIVVLRLHLSKFFEINQRYNAIFSEET